VIADVCFYDHIGALWNSDAGGIESALKEVNTRVKDHVKQKTGAEKDGSDLMHSAFSPKQPVVQLERRLP